MTAGPEPAFRDRRARLVVLGILAIGVGAFCCLLTLLMALLAMHPEELGIPRSAIGAAGLTSVLPAAVLFALLGAAFIACGVGSLKAKRWVRPVMLTLSWTWLAAGSISLVLLVVAGREALPGGAGAGDDLPPGVVGAVWAITLGIVAVVEVVLPLVFIWGYRPKDVQLTAEVRHPAPSWADRVPSQVLGLTIALAASAVLMVPFAFHTVFPIFGVLVGDAPATLLNLAMSALLGALAWGCYRLQSWAWWGVLALTIVFGASASITCLAVSPEDVARSMGLSPEQADALRESGLAGNPWVAGSVALATLTFAVYLLMIRKHFRA